MPTKHIEDRYQEELKRFGKHIRLVRTKKGFSRQEDFGKVCGINRTQMNRIERGSANIEFETLVKLAEGSRLPLVALFDYDNAFEAVPVTEYAGLPHRIKVEKEKLGARLLQLREGLGMIQLDIEVDVGIGRSAISEYEKGKGNLEFRTLVKFIVALQVDIVDLFSYNE